jgi:hypothetical protein
MSLKQVAARHPALKDQQARVIAFNIAQQIVNATIEDSAEGYDLEAGLFGTALSSVIFEIALQLANHTPQD